MRRLDPFAASPVAAIAIVVLLASPGFSQQPSRPASDVDPARARFEENNRREIQLRGMAGAKQPDPKELEAVASRIKEDFERILSLHNGIVRALGSANAIKYSFVSETTAEIKKRASRLQTTLALDKLEPADLNQHKLDQLNDEQMKDSLITLCKQIERFVGNPIIKNPGTIDAAELAHARHDLEGVIQLAAGINKNSERLKKNSQ
jgi:hypothetical protein